MAEELQLKPVSQPEKNTWFCLGSRDVLKQLQTQESGLTHDEAQLRLTKYGPNELPRQPTPSLARIFLNQFLSPLIFILGIAAVVSVVIHEYTDAGFIAAVLVLNAIIGSFQEWKAEKSSRALEKILKIRTTVVRESEIQEIPAEELVPGDMVYLESGSRIPADLRLISTQGLEVEEAPLTGESLPVTKDGTWQGKSDTALADRLNMAYAGTTVTRGRGKGVVIATGQTTVIGQLALDVFASGSGKPPLLIRLERFTKVIGLMVLAAAFLVALLGILKGFSATDMFLFAVALAVSAIPEGLPVAVTVALAIGTNRMAKRGVIVRKLAAVEGLGSCTLIASDKTGTLTCNELTVQKVMLPDHQAYEVTGEGYEPEGQILFHGSPIAEPHNSNLLNLIRAAALCNEASLYHRESGWGWHGDPTDVALLSLAQKAKISREELIETYPQVQQIPFEPEYRYSATFHQNEGKISVLAKGAPEKILEMCKLGNGETERETHLEAAQQLADAGYRVLAFAQRELTEAPEPDKMPPEPTGLTFLGFVGMIDPLRPGVQQAVQACYGAGIQVAMVTGDHPVTALAIAKQLGLAQTPDQVMTGGHLEKSADSGWSQLIKGIRVFSRVTPHEKLKIVSAEQQQGQFVAVTGDGVNDAPALRAANIGVAMGKSGTDVARDASDIVISDDNFATIVNGVEEGRIAYDNVRKVIYLLISTGAAEVIMVTLSVAFSLPLPLLPVQLLWLNLVTNGIQDVALAFEPGEDNVLKRKPRPTKERIFNPLMVERTIVGAIVMGGVAFGTFYWMLKQGWSEYSARNAILLLMVLFENIHIGNCRSETVSVFKLSLLSSPILLFGALTAFSIHVLSLYIPIGQKILGTEPVDFSTWLALILLALTVLMAMEIHKLIWRWRQRGKG